MTCRVIGAPRRPFETLDQLVEFSSVLGDVALVASELVMNAVLHSGCTTDHLLNVRASLDPEGLLISVQDPGISGTGAKVRPEAVRAAEERGWICDRPSTRAWRYAAERT